MSLDATKVDPGSSVLITGATGTLGGRVLRSLQQRGVSARALVRDAAAGPLPGAADTVVGDYADRRALVALMAGVDRVFLVAPNGPAQVEHECSVIDAAVSAGVSLIVKISALGADAAAPVAFWRAHAEIEDHLTASGVRAVSLRPAYLMSNLLGEAPQVRQHGLLPTPAVGAGVAMVDPDDVAEAAARLITLPESALAPGHRRWQLTGPRAVAFAEIADALSDVTGHPVAHLAASPDQARAALAQQGVPALIVEQILELFAAIDRGAHAGPTTDVATLLGRAPGGVEDFLRRHAHLFTRAADGAASH
ncbi:NmrA family NAD(P)-binding protein [Micropruina glycogenica]|uniref:NmrA family protein n=1 Tax=Micropruina glycogenica TaxID=75385 RepID=A0A2N9JHP1_9ACTN|nr:NAD(P)H-binding protein [Micropruina glycogenica]SPD87058.1 NmrA family protein [Micropruina glycogenica]